MPKLPDVSRYESLADLTDDSLPLLGDKVVMVKETIDGPVEWRASDLLRRARLAAWRLHSAGVGSKELMLIWASSGPEQLALFLGTWKLGVVLVPLDQRLTPQVVARIADRAGTRWLVAGDGPELAELDPQILSGHVRLSLSDLISDDTSSLPPDWETQLDALPRPTRKDLFAVMYTSGTTGQPRGAMLSNGNFIDPWQKGMGDWRVRLFMRLGWGFGNMRTISVMPQSHVFGLGEVIGVALMGMTIYYPRSRSPRALLEAMRAHKPTTFSGAPRFLDIVWKQLMREIAEDGGLEDFERRRARAQRYPYWIRRRMFRSELARMGGKVRVMTSGAAYLAPDLQESWQSIGLPVVQGYGATECGAVAATSFFRHPVGKVGRPMRTANVELAADGEILTSGPGVSAGYWRDPEATAKSFDREGRYHTGDIGRFDEKGNLVLLGRKKNVIVLSNGLNVYPEDIEAALHIAGLGDTVVLETTPGRIEAVVLDPGREMAALDLPETVSLAERRDALRERINQLVRTANARLTQHERIDGWRLWPDPDFPRTHTQKIRRDPVREWAAQPGSVPLPVRDGIGAEA